MNTRKVFFGIMAIAFLAMTAVSSDVLTQDDVDGKTKIEKSKLKKL